MCANGYFNIRYQKNVPELQCFLRLAYRCPHVYWAATFLRSGGEAPSCSGAGFNIPLIVVVRVRTGWRFKISRCFKCNFSAGGIHRKKVCILTLDSQSYMLVWPFKALRLCLPKYPTGIFSNADLYRLV